MEMSARSSIHNSTERRWVPEEKGKMNSKG
jgi:hypothetical protein